MSGASVPSSVALGGGAGMPLEGEVIVTLAWDSRSVVQAGVRSTRPRMIPRLMSGRSPEDAAASVPLLFSICARAQGMAAAGALEAALGEPASTRTLECRERVLIAETVQEALWRLLIDFPRAMGAQPQTEPVAHARRLIDACLKESADQCMVLRADCAAPDTGSLGDALDALAGRWVFGRTSREWLAIADLDALRDALAAGGPVPMRMLAALLRDSPGLGAWHGMLMPALDPESIPDALLRGLEGDPAFSAAPHWSGEPVETGALARMRGHPLVAAARRNHGDGVLARLLARLCELASLTGLLASGEPAPAPRMSSRATGPRQGASCVETVRGLLLHAARLEDGRVADYRIVAPTEWNFHPRGALVQGLTGAPADGLAELERTASLVVQSLDPCVDFRLEIAHA